MVGLKHLRTPRLFSALVSSWLICAGLFLVSPSTSPLQAQSLDSLLDGVQDGSSLPESSDTSSNDPDELIRDAESLLFQKKSVDARAKLQKALQLRPEDHRIHLLLGQYYLTEVGHFTLAYRYIKKAEELFEKKYSGANARFDSERVRDEVGILYLKSEAELNLDKYKESLATLDRMAEIFPVAALGSYMATRAWVLMKLKRPEEALQVAQEGLLIDEDSKRIHNILGILLSVTGKRELSLKAFAKAVAGELSYGSRSQAATPLNNAGEVYREIFRDSLAEASWLRALQMSDGCDHILPSLNMSFLYIDQLRLIQAERVLKDFEVCYATQSSRQDTEHRVLLALSRGRIALHSGDFDNALTLLKDALEREQWFGKIGTDEKDVRLATTIAMANALETQANVMQDSVRDRLVDKLQDQLLIPQLRLRSWWLHRQARRLAVKDLADFEDLSIRNSDTMLEYPTLGSTLAGFPREALERRLNRLMTSDEREGARLHYQLYLAESLLADGKTQRAISILSGLRTTLRPIDRLAKTRALTLLLKAQEANASWWSNPSREDLLQSMRTREELFELAPAEIRGANLWLPVSSHIQSPDGQSNPTLKKLRKLLSARLPEADDSLREEARYLLRMEVGSTNAEGTRYSLELLHKPSGNILASYAGSIAADGTGTEALIRNFLQSAFHHKADQPGEPVPPLELINDAILDM